MAIKIETIIAILPSGAMGLKMVAGNTKDATETELKLLEELKPTFQELAQKELIDRGFKPAINFPSKDKTHH
ncbi:TPA: hypothetical protein MJA79_18930 [Klebsiella pneumoniae]|uniref:hypothetical protein n=1 Tax=Serratia marcescens TaxID=615 RepID=UPI000D96C4B8|nr:hypothetical protein [Serratia marcescens]SQC25634.1 Uncharacterised protein [Klebsiella pneumoniae]STS65833.1 Uncharacterised protein [Klebsiella pneumoniae]STS69845.1 Uncharacterised protein [Klebsiella pneumoniae]SUY90216.1 Uncharacterised protein [Klebsiella pneumoniae]HBY9741596.1 hypothetical protein [Klebsiella pneumoniae]